jgi:hypothetical protein
MGLSRAFPHFFSNATGSMRRPMVHMLKAKKSPGTPAGESRGTWRVYRPRQLAREGGGPAATRAARLREYHVSSQHAEARAGTRSLHRAVPFPPRPHRDFRVFVLRRKSWVRKVLVNFLECPGGARTHVACVGCVGLRARCQCRANKPRCNRRGLHLRPN